MQKSGLPRIVGMELRLAALTAFELCDPMEKVRAVNALWQQVAVDKSLPLNPTATLPAPSQPGRPAKPVLVEPKEVPRRSPYTADGHAALIHSITHIEFNAINLALDAVWRFAGLPEAYYLDWLRVAWEEAKHFSLLRGHLLKYGYDYGDFSAHDGLWTMCDNTRHDVTARMALVPRTLEARGLDATPLIQTKLRKVGTPQALEAVALLDIILAEEVGHVTAGNHWYHYLCEKQGLDSGSFYAQAAAQHGGPRAKPPFNMEARRLAGFTEAELQALGVAA